jgi:hypothetical protein
MVSLSQMSQLVVLSRLALVVTVSFRISLKVRGS